MNGRLSRPTLIRFSLTAAAALFASAKVSAAPIASYTGPHIVTRDVDVTAKLGSTTFVNHGLVGVGRVSASATDVFRDSLGSVSGLAITNWVRTGKGTYSGVFNILPDRGYNNGSVYSDFAARINQFSFEFTPVSAHGAHIGGTDPAGKMAAQNQIVAKYVGGVKFTYEIGSGTSTTTGLNPAVGAAGVGSIPISTSVPFVTTHTPAIGRKTRPAVTVNKLTLDSEALVLKADGSGYIGDEYGPNIYHFDAGKKIDGLLGIPDSLKPHGTTTAPTGTTNYDSADPPADGRRRNHGFEGVSLSPDGTKLFALLESGTIQDNNADKDRNRLNTRLLIYDLTAGAVPAKPSAEYVMQLPTYTQSGDDSAADKTAAQSEILALDNKRFLVLARDAAGPGSPNPTVVKQILLVDTSVGNPTNIHGTASDLTGGMVVPGGTVTVKSTRGAVVTVASVPSGLAVGSGLLGRTVSGIADTTITLSGISNAMISKPTAIYFNSTTTGALKPGITPLVWTEVVNMLNAGQLARFNINTTNSQPDLLTLSEKWEGMALVSALDPLAPNDYFLFIGNDNDFITPTGHMQLSDGRITFNAVSAAHLSAGYQNDTMFLAYRVTIVP